MKIDINNETFRIFWKYQTRSNGWRLTTCYVVNKDDVVVIAAIADCSPDDQFVKDTGRKISLTRAISKFDKDTRKRIWETYHGKKTEVSKPKASDHMVATA